MRTVLIWLAFVGLLPIALFLLYGLAKPEQLITALGLPLWWLTLPVGLIGMTGMYALWIYGWLGKRIFSVAFVRLTTLAFAAFIVAMFVKFQPFSSLGIWAFYAGWFGLFAFAAFTLPFASAAVLIWYSRPYILGGTDG
jgi:hypothetical protein